jgi:sulfatase maturation enzyme AslB (radical SAM superfamily)
MSNMCYHPWVGLDINPQGGFKPCCKYQNHLSDNLDDYLASPELDQLRNDFLNNKRPTGCNSCWSDEDAGLPSKRTIDNKYIFAERAPNLNSLKVLSLPFGNTCNLACRTCGSFASSRWGQEERKLKKYFPDITILGHKKFYKDSNYIEKIKNISTELIDITFPGGEPFITGVPQQLEFLDFLLETNPENITINYITNTTTFPPEEFWDKWGRFKQINIQLSIDGIEEMFEYTRWPASWNECYTNIKRYQQMQEIHSNLRLSISHTVSVFNIFNIQDFFIWCLKEKLPEPYIGMVHYPEYYSIKILPPQIKEKIKEKITSKKFDFVINYMDQTNSNEFVFDTTVKWIKSVDKLRNQNFSVLRSEFAEFLK